MFRGAGPNHQCIFGAERAGGGDKGNHHHGEQPIPPTAPFQKTLIQQFEYAVLFILTEVSTYVFEHVLLEDYALEHHISKVRGT